MSVTYLFCNSQLIDVNQNYSFISQLTNLCKTLAAAILLTSSTHFGARLGAFFY